jgi:hypothetical protein
MIWTKSTLYTTWRGMKQRCCDKNHRQYKNYGGRGVTVCQRWLDSFENFLADMGNKPTPRHTLDRIDNDGNYEPSNCRWATWFEQARSKIKHGKYSKAMPISERVVYSETPSISENAFYTMADLLARGGSKRWLDKAVAYGVRVVLAGNHEGFMGEDLLAYIKTQNKVKQEA